MGKEKKEKEKKKTKADFMKVSKKDLFKYKAWVKLARKKRSKEFTPVAKEMNRMYNNEGVSIDEDGEELVTVNLVFPNKEIEKPSIFFRNPRIFVKPTQEEFIMSDGKKLDGERAAGLIEAAANYIASTKKLVREVKDVRDDALKLTYGILETGYKGEIRVSEDGDDYVFNEEIFFKRISPYRFLVDVDSLDCRTFKDAKWVAKEVVMTFEDFEEDDYFENKEDISLEGLEEAEDAEIITEEATEELMETVGKEYLESGAYQKIKLIIMWIKPSRAERKILKKGETGGKIIIFSMNGDLPHKVLPWPYKIDKFPFRGLGFYRDNEKFYPISDIAQYKQQLDEINRLRTAQLKNVEAYGKRKILVDKTLFDSEEEYNKFVNGELGGITGVNIGGSEDIRKRIFVVQFGSSPNEIYTLDRKCNQDADKISGQSDLSRGMALSGVDTASEVKEISAHGSARSIEKKADMEEFYGDISRYMIQLIKQYWKPETMVRRLGITDPEWTENFSKEDIDIEDDVEIDIGEMVPVNEIMRQQQALKRLELLIKGVVEEKVSEKLAMEGYELNLVEMFKETLRAFNIRNTKVLQKLDFTKYAKILEKLYQEKMQKQAMGNPQQQQGGGGGGANLGGTPSYPNTIGAANRGAYPTEEMGGGVQ